MSSSFSPSPTFSTRIAASSAPWHWSIKCTIAGDLRVGKTELLACRERIEWIRRREKQKYQEKIEEEGEKRRKRWGEVEEEEEDAERRRREESGEIPLRSMESLRRNLAPFSSQTDSVALGGFRTIPFEEFITSGMLRRRTPHVFRCFEVISTGSLLHNFSSCPSFDMFAEASPPSPHLATSVLSSISSAEMFRWSSQHHPHHHQNIVSGSGKWMSMRGGMGYSPLLHSTVMYREGSQDFHKEEGGGDDDEEEGEGGGGGVQGIMRSREWKDNKRKGEEKGGGGDEMAMRAMCMWGVEKSLDSVRGSGCSSSGVAAAAVVAAAAGTAEYTLGKDHATLDEVNNDFSEDNNEGHAEGGSDATASEAGGRRQKEVEKGGGASAAAAAGGGRGRPRQEKNNDQKKEMGRPTRLLPFQAMEKVEPTITSASPFRNLHNKKKHRKRSRKQQQQQQHHHLPRGVSSSSFLHTHSRTASSLSSGELTVELCLWDSLSMPSLSSSSSSPSSSSPSSYFPPSPSVLSNFSSSSIILLVCSAVDRESFLNIGEWVHCCRSFASPNSVIALVLNKVDLLYAMQTASASCTNPPLPPVFSDNNNGGGGGGEYDPFPVEETEKNVVTVEEASAFAQAHQLLFFSCSAIHNEGVEWLFHEVATEVLKRVALRQIVPEGGEEEEMEVQFGSRYASLLVGYRSGVELHPLRREVSKAVGSEEDISWGFCCGYWC